MDNDMRAVEAIVLPENISSRRYSKAMNKTFPVLLGQHALESNLAQGIGRHAELLRGYTISIQKKEFTGMGTTTLLMPTISPALEDPSIGEELRFALNLITWPRLTLEVERQKGKRMKKRQCTPSSSYLQLCSSFRQTRFISFLEEKQRNVFLTRVRSMAAARSKVVVVL
jgi:hypothetical protein